MEPIVGKLYQHFKGNIYRVLNFALHTETGEKLVIYQDANDETKIYARPYEMFKSKVDKEKYPDATQEYRFEEFDASSVSPINPKVLEFLDVKSFTDKVHILEELKPVITKDMINTMAFSLDIEINDASVEEMYLELLNSVSLREKYEGDRLRR